MTEPLPGDVAYWLEAAEARAAKDLSAHLMSDSGNPLGAGYEVNGETLAFWLEAVDIAFFNRCLGLGIGRPATRADIERALGAFEAAGRAQFIIQVSPLARPARLEQWLVALGLRRGRRWVKAWREAADSPASPSSLRVEEIGADGRGDWERVTLSAFELPELLAPATSATLGREGWHHYMTFDGSMAVGAGAMHLAHGVAWLGFGATLESHRGLGSQRALLSRRIGDAAALGARLVVTETGEELPDEVNPSFRNMLATGFHVGYFRQNWLSPALE